MTGRKVLVWLLVLLVAAIVPAVVVPTLMCKQPDVVLDDYGDVGKFALIDERGQPFTQEAFVGHPTIVSFIFTRCDTICPVTSMRMEKIQEQTFTAGHRIKLLSISVDPTYDTPARLAEYAARYHADPERWRFVTGPVDGIEGVKQLVEGAFMNSMQRDGDTPTGAPNIAHNGHFALVDSFQHIRGFYDSRDVARLETLMRDARYLARTQQP